ncbi:hypothetical protein [Streptomyces sp. TRM68367]|uniref:hypothetical protein n=1 Tax=Streptomyces sp. TRM68367 TaxID=2758415 RepID=UPI00165BFDCD|nr:hypothetical protein [Streptomyces sp. TRM68367]MBC9724367.1 hypothetical protein [Streptomyces sp. TRM68367]
MEIDNLTAAELRVWRAYPRGEAVDFRAAGDDDPAEGTGWGPERTLRAAVLRALLVGAPQEDGEIPVLKVAGARIAGSLNLMYAEIDHAVRLSQCRFDEAPKLYGSRLRQLNLAGSALPGVSLGSTRVDGVLRLTECRFQGPVRLGGAQISAALFMERARIAAPDAQEPALQLNHVTLGDDLWAPGLRVHGLTRLNGATVAVSVNLEDAEFVRRGGHVIVAEALNVGANVLARRLRADGRVGLRGARMRGRCRPWGPPRR